MHKRILGDASVLTALFTVLLAFIAVTPSSALASGGSSTGGGGGGGGVVESRVTGYVTSIDYANNMIVIGASYYGTGILNATAATKVSLNNVNSTFDQIKVGDWAEARFIWSTRQATKLAITRR